MGKIVAFTGESNSGKTTLIQRLLEVLTPKYQIAVIKHDPKDKATFDTPGKDSYKFFQGGGDVAVISPFKTTIMSHQSLDMEMLCKIFGDKDYIFIEGLKTLPFPRMCVVRDRILEEYIECSDVFVVDGCVGNAHLIPRGMQVLNLNNLEEILVWINQFGKVING